MCVLILSTNLPETLPIRRIVRRDINPLNAELNPICHLLALLGARHIFHVGRIRVKFGCKWVLMYRCSYLIWTKL